MARPSSHQLVSICHDGKEYRGTYSVSDGGVLVRYEGRAKEAELGGLKHYPEQLAEMLLSELVRGLP